MCNHVRFILSSRTGSQTPGPLRTTSAVCACMQTQEANETRNGQIRNQSHLVMSSSEHTLFFYFRCVIMYLRYSGNPRGVVQGHAEEEEEYGGETREMELGWEGAAGRTSLEIRPSVMWLCLIISVRLSALLLPL